MSRYSLSASKLSFSLQKNKQKFVSYNHQDIFHKSIKQPIQKIKQIGEEKYRTAMKHMEKFKKYDQEIKHRKIIQNQVIDNQCTFKPKINKNRKYMNLAPRFMMTSYTQRYSKDRDLNPESNSLGGFKQEHMKETLNLKKSKQNLKKQKIVQKWDKDQDLKRLHKSMQKEERKSLQRISSLSVHQDRRHLVLQIKSKQTVGQMNEKVIAANNRIDELSQQDEQVGQQSIEEESYPINEIKSTNQDKKHKNSLFFYNKLTQITTSIIDLNINHKKLNQSKNYSNKVSHPNLRRLYTENFSILSVDSSDKQGLQQSHQNLNKELNKYSNSYQSKINRDNQTFVQNNHYTKKYQNQITIIKK